MVMENNNDYHPTRGGEPAKTKEGSWAPVAAIWVFALVVICGILWLANENPTDKDMAMCLNHTKVYIAWVHGCAECDKMTEQYEKFGEVWIMDCDDERNFDSCAKLTDFPAVLTTARIKTFGNNTSATIIAPVAYGYQEPKKMLEICRNATVS